MYSGWAGNLKGDTAPIIPTSPAMFPELQVMEVILQSLGMLPSQIRFRFYVYIQISFVILSQKCFLILMACIERNSKLNNRDSIVTTTSPKTSLNSSNHEYLNPINILGIPNPNHRRSNQDRQPGGGSVQETNKMNLKFLKSSARCGMGSLLNLNKIGQKTSLQRSNSARECSLIGGVITNCNITRNSSNNDTNNSNQYDDRLQVCINHYNNYQK